MKRIGFLLILLIVSSAVLHAQSRDIRRAGRQLNRGNLADAKQHLEDAKEHEEAFNDPEFWITKAQLHLEIAITEEEEYKNLSDDPVGVADNALFMAKKLDTDNQLILDIQPMLLFLSELVFNEGAEAYQNNEWLKASEMFLRAYEIGLEFNQQDTTTYYYAAISAEQGHAFEKALKIYQDLLDMDYEEPFLYTSLSNISLHLGDTLKAREYTLEGRERYPDNLDIIFQEANIYIFTGDIDAARRILDIAIQRDPENPALHFAFGANYDKMYQDTSYSEEDRQFAFNEAIKAYENAIELKPDYFDAVYNIGVLYFNRGIRIFEESEERLRETYDFAQYEKDAEKIKEAWLEAQPYLEEAKSMLDMDDPNIEIVVISLVELYARTEQPEKLEEIMPLYRKFYGGEEEMQE